jgi:hypothetical protein
VWRCCVTPSSNELISYDHVVSLFNVFVRSDMNSVVSSSRVLMLRYYVHCQSVVTIGSS